MDKAKRVTYKNNWESHEYYVGGKLVESAAALDKVVVFEKGSDVGRVYKVRPNKETVEYDDMGNTFTATSMQYYIGIKTDIGVHVDLPLNLLMNKGCRIEVP